MIGLQGWQTGSNFWNSKHKKKEYRLIHLPENGRKIQEAGKQDRVSFDCLSTTQGNKQITFLKTHAKVVTGSRAFLNWMCTNTYEVVATPFLIVSSVLATKSTRGPGICVVISGQRPPTFPGK